MRYVGGGVGHYQVDIPEEEEVPTSADSDDDDPMEPDVTTDPEVPLLPPVTPPRTPEPDDQGRPGSSLSQASGSSKDSDSSASTVDLDSEKSGSDSEDEGQVGEPDLGPEDGDGFVDDEVQEGYTAL